MTNWQTYLAARPQAHILQTAEWGALKSAFGWRARALIVGETGAQILFKPLPLGFSIGYIGRGPVGENWLEMLPALDDLCARERAILLKVEPDQWEDARGLADSPVPPGFRASPHTVQPARTITLDLTPTEDEILARMKQKTRYNIRLAAKKGITIREWDDLPAFHALMQTTGGRDGFGVHSLDYYRRAYELFHPLGACHLLVAEYEAQPLAALMLFTRGTRAWYFYGASNEMERNRMPTYLLQWEAIRRAKALGCTEYDLWGIPDYPEATLESQFEQRADGLWGVYRFKRGFGGTVRRAVGAWDRVYNPILYTFYQRWVR
ncbi:MAG: peptidoglycan bridge formation glycyltransferase FemA/FemB family protein [Anaerolineales bacterium]